MRAPTTTICLAFALGASALAPAAHASAPTGVWSLPGGVTIIEREGAQPQVVIEGLFTVWTGEGAVGGDWGMQGYAEAIVGYLVYRCEPGEKALCLMQWDEIAAAVDKEEPCVGWGNQDEAPGTVRATGDTTSPDPYPIDQGVVSGYTPCNYLHGVTPVVEPAPEATPEAAPESGPEPTPEAPAEAAPVEDVAVVPDATASDDVAATTSASDTASGADTAVAGESASEGGACHAGGLGSGFGALLALAGLALRRRRTA